MYIEKDLITEFNTQPLMQSTLSTYTNKYTHTLHINTRCFIDTPRFVFQLNLLFHYFFPQFDRFELMNIVYACVK